MKNSLLSAIFLLFFIQTFSQRITQPYYDAIQLSKESKKDASLIDVEEVAKILANYLADSLVNPRSAEKTIVNFKIGNPFFKDYFKFDRTGQSGSPFDLAQNALSSLGGLSIPNDILLGVTDFIVKRTKQELSIAFFDKFRTLLSDRKFIDLQTVFPQTYKSLIAVGDEIYQYDAYIQGLRAAFKKDIEALDKNLPTIIDNHPTFWNKHKEWKASLQSAFYIAGALADKVHPGDILNDYPTDYLDSLNTNWKGAIQTLQLLSASLRDKGTSDTARYWVTPKQVKQLISDETTFKIYLGLVYQQAKMKDSILFTTKNKIVLVRQDITPIRKNNPSIFSANEISKPYKIMSINNDTISLSVNNTIKLLSIKRDDLPLLGSTEIEFSKNDSILVKNDTISLVKTLFTDTTSLIKILNLVADSFPQYYKQYATFITHISDKTNKLSTLIKNNTKPANDSIAFQQYYDYYNATLDLLQQCTEISTLHFIDKLVPHLADTLKPYFDIAHTTADLVMDIKKKSYSSAITDASHIYSVVKAKQAEKDLANLPPAGTVPNTTGSESKRKRKQRRVLVKNVKEAVENGTVSHLDLNALTANTTTSTTQNDSLRYDTLQPIVDSKDALFKYGSFMAALCTANSPAEVTNAIEAFALPVGSSRIKRESKFNVSLNAYCGFFIGNEVIKGINENRPFDFKHWNSYGVTAPIGISVSLGKQKSWGPIPNLSNLFCNQNKFEGHWSYSLFFSVVDLGAVAAYRFTDDAASQVPTVQLKDIFSPGAFLSIGIPKSPLSINLGAQVGPNLRNINNSNSTDANATYTRYSISFCVDIPVLNFYTKSK